VVERTRSVSSPQMVGQRPEVVCRSTAGRAHSRVYKMGQRHRRRDGMDLEPGRQQRHQQRSQRSLFRLGSRTRPGQSGMFFFGPRLRKLHRMVKLG